MSEKAKNKHGKARKYSIKTTFLITGAILLPVLLSLTLYLFSAYSLIGIYKILGIITLMSFVGLIGMGTLATVFFADRWIEKLATGLLLLVMVSGIVSGAADLFFYLLLVIAIFAVPISLLVLIVMVILILLQREPVSESKLTGLTVIAFILSLSFITGHTYKLGWGDVRESIYIEEESYHLFESTALFDLDSFGIYKCNSIGILCEELYRTGHSYRDNYPMVLRIDDSQKAIQLFANGNLLYQHPID